MTKDATSFEKSYGFTCRTNSKSLGAGTRMLPSLSPLTDRSKLLATPQLENVATGLNAFGYECGYDNGHLQVSHPYDSPRPSDAPSSASLDIFMGSLTRPHGNSMRPRLSSMLTFSKAPAAGPRMSDRPKTSGSAGQGSSSHSSLSMQPRPSTSCLAGSGGPGAGGRFNRLAHSMDSLSALKVSSSTNMPHANLLALTEPTYGGLPRMPSPQRPLRPPPLAVHASSSSPQLQPDSGAATPNGDAPLHELEGSPGGAGDGGSPQLPRPATSTIHLGEDAAAAMRTGQAGHPLTPTMGGSGARSPGTVTLQRMDTSRRRTMHPMAGFKPTRGQALIVFQDLDRDKNGKVTLAELEDAALSLGFSLDQARRMFDRLDPSKKGYLIASDWGKREVVNLVEIFTHMYMVKYLGLPGPTASQEQVKKYQALQALKAQRTLPAAINMARINAVTRGAHASTGTGNAIYDAFSFIDTDRNGTLSFEELRDGFYALGVYLTDEVLQDMMRYFDTNQDQKVDYGEFVARMFPSRAKMH